MRCPWTREVQKQMYNPVHDDPKNLSNSEVVISQFGKCIEFECPFYDGLRYQCNRVKM